jgi:hypothetical protein
MATMSEQELAELLVETGHAHHAAYAASDGVDPEWAGWYGPYLQARVGDRLGRRVTRSELTYLLIRAEREHNAADDDSSWPGYYAAVILGDDGLIHR